MGDRRLLEPQNLEKYIFQVRTEKGIIFSIGLAGAREEYIIDEATSYVSDCTYSLPGTKNQLY